MEAEKNKQLEIVKIKVQLQEYAGLVYKAANSLKKATEDKKIKLLSEKINAYKAAYDILYDELKELDKEVSSSKTNKTVYPYGGGIFPSTTGTTWTTTNASTTTPYSYSGGGTGTVYTNSAPLYLTYPSIDNNSEVVVKDWYNDQISNLSTAFAKDKEEYYLKKIQEYPG